jgi:hypothetical protein
MAMPSRIAGNFGPALDTATEAFELAVRHKIPEEAAASADLLASVSFEKGDLDLASRWLDRAEPWIRRLTTKYARTSASHTRAMIALERGDISGAVEHVPISVDEASRTTAIRHRLFHLSVLARVGVARNDAAAVRLCAGHLRAALTHAKAFRYTEYFIASLAIAVSWLESPQAGRDILSEYSDPSRDLGVRVWREYASLRERETGR